MNPVDVTPLLRPLTLAGMTVPNRFVMPGMQRGWCEDGAPTARLTEYYRRRVEGGVGLIISESVAVDHPSSTRSELFARLTPSTLEAWQACVGAVKDAGGHILLQLWHEGAIRREDPEGPWARHPTLSPSGLAYTGRENGRAATIDEVERIRDAFIRSALLAKAAGADGVEVHGAHGYLLDQFLWPETNRREDRYGGADIRDRARLLAEIVAGIREACGRSFVISVRYSQWKEADFGAKIARTPDELGEFLATIRGGGADVLHASTRRFWQPEWEESDLGLAGWTRRLSGLPVIAVGSVGVASALMERPDPAGTGGLRLQDGLRELTRRFSDAEFDLVAVGRSLIADPDWVRKVAAGDLAAVRGYRRGDLGVPTAHAGSIEVPIVS